MCLAHRWGNGCRNIENDETCWIVELTGIEYNGEDATTSLNPAWKLARFDLSYDYEESSVNSVPMLVMEQICDKLKSTDSEILKIAASDYTSKKK